MDLPSIAEQAERPYVSTGHLPAAETVQKLVSDAHRRFKWNIGGKNSKNSQVYSALASDLFGVCVVGTSGSVCAAGEFVLVCETIGPEKARDKLEANATGLAAGGSEGVASAVTDVGARSRLVGCARTSSGGSAWSTLTPLSLLAPY
jgi:hypothetical protein